MIGTRLFLRTLWDDLKSSLWFRPLVITLTAAALSMGSVSLDHAVTPPEFLITSPDNARALLSAIVSSMLTVTTLTFSIIMVALAMASQQFSPRILRNFMSDTVSQNVIGLFSGTLIYGLLALNQIDESFESSFVPGITVGVCLLLAFLSLSVFIYFIHHIAKSIHVTSIVHEIGKDTEALIEATYNHSRTAALPKTGIHSEGEADRVYSPRTGYIQAVDVEALVHLAKKYDLLIVLERKVGEYISKDTSLLYIQPQERVSGEVRRLLGRMFDIGAERTLYQDILFGVRQLEDIAVKAISPAINDPTTAVNCLDHLSSILIKLARYPDLSPYYYDDEGNLRAIIHQVVFEDFVENSFNQIRQYAISEVAVTLRMLEVLAEVAQVTKDGERLEVLWKHARIIGRGADRGIVEPYDRQKVNRRIERLATVVGQSAKSLLLTDPGPLHGAD